MNKQTLNAIAYSENALSFLFLDSGIKDSINSIYLFGSASRGELTKDSDIDIFIDCVPESEKQIGGIAKAAMSKFYQSNDYEKWKLFKFDYPISIESGDLNKWQLKTSITADGILLYSKNAIEFPAERKILLIFELPKKKGNYLSFIRKLFGRNEKGYADKGLLGQFNGEKISSNAIIFPRENYRRVIDFMQKEKINYSFKEIAVFE